MNDTINTCSSETASSEDVAVVEGREATRATRRPNVASRATDSGLEIRFELPGATRESIELSVEDGELRLAATTALADHVGPFQASRIEFHPADFAGRWTLPEDVTAEGATTSFENGVLILELPRHTATRHTIEVR